MTETISAPDTPEAITRTSVLAFFAADHVALSPDSKLYVNGGFFSLLRFVAFPATLPTLGIGAVLEMPFQDSMQDHVLTIGLRGPDQNDLPVRVEARFRTTPTIDAQFGEQHLVPFGVTVQNIQFPSAGVYKLVLSLDGKERKAYRLRAVQTPAVVVPGAPPPAAGPA